MIKRAALLTERNNRLTHSKKCSSGRMLLGI